MSTWGNQIVNPYAQQVQSGENGNGAGPGSVLARGLAYLSRTALQYLPAEYASVIDADVAPLPILALPAIVGGKPRLVAISRPIFFD